jgi:hypothetical protein
MERELEHELREAIRSLRLRPASCLALSCEEPNMAGYGNSVNLLLGERLQGEVGIDVGGEERSSVRLLWRDLAVLREGVVLVHRHKKAVAVCTSKDSRAKVQSTSFVL